MLTTTFAHLDGLSTASELRLWAGNVLSWEHCLREADGLFRGRRLERVQAQLAESHRRLQMGDYAWFASRLPPLAQPRIYPHAVGRIAYVDIETTGLGSHAEITTIALYDGETVQTFVRGRDLDGFPALLSRYNLLVTFNGKQFDVPFIQREFGMEVNLPHLDMRWILRALGHRGGLKSCENQLGIRRQVPEDMGGGDAVVLWYMHLRGDPLALPRLLAYNAQDVLSLEQLLVMAYNMSMRDWPGFDPLTIPDQPFLAWPEEDPWQE